MSSLFRRGRKEGWGLDAFLFSFLRRVERIRRTELNLGVEEVWHVFRTKNYGVNN